MLRKMQQKIMNKGKPTGREDSITSSGASKSGTSIARTHPSGSSTGLGTSPPSGPRDANANSGTYKHALPTPLGVAARKKYFGEALPTLREVPLQEKQPLFVRKLQLCAFTFDFADPVKDLKEKEVKRQTLIEIVDYVSNGPQRFNDAVAEDVIAMIGANIFRSLPASASTAGGESYDPEEEEPVLDPTWPHLQVSRTWGMFHLGSFMHVRITCVAML